MIVIVMIGVSACSKDVAEEPEESSIFQIKFNVYTKNPGGLSRAEGDSEAPEEREGSGAENFLNIDDIQYLIFDSDKKFLCDVSAEARTLAVDETYTLYEVTARVNDPYFYTHFDDTVDFYILVLANLKDWGVTMPELTTETGLDDVFGNGLVMTTLPDAAELKQASDYMAPGRQYFPMAGLQHFTVAGSMLRLAEGVPFDLTNATGKSLDMLRSLCKLEVVDRINIPADSEYNEVLDGNSPLRIDEVALFGYTTCGRLLPALTQWSVAGNYATRQINTPDLPPLLNPAAIYQSPPPLNDDLTIGDDPGEADAYPRLMLSPDPVATHQRKDKCPVYSCYVFEYNAAPMLDGGVNVARLPYFGVKIRGGEIGTGDNTETQSPMQYYIRMARYTNSNAGAYDYERSLLRNHIYRYEVAAVGAQLKVEWHICNMQEASADIVFN